MGTCKFGVLKVDSADFVPFISFNEGENSMKLVADSGFPSEEIAREAVVAMFKVLSGDKKNVKIFPCGEPVNMRQGPSNGDEA